MVVEQVMKAKWLLVSLGFVVLPAWGATTFKIATIIPEGSFWMQEMRSGAAEIKQRTEGRVQLKFYSGGVQGSDKKVLRKIRIGQLHGGAFTATGLTDHYPALNLYGYPMLFQSPEEVDFVRPKMDPILQDGLYEAGFASFGFAEGGFAYLMSNDPIDNLTQLRGRKVWVPEGDRMSFVAMEKLGLSPTVLPMTDVLTGLQTRLLDVVATSPVGALVLQWHTKVKYITNVPVVYLFGFLALDRKVFDRVAPNDQATMREVLEKNYRNIDSAARQDDANALQALRQAGLGFVEVTNQEIQLWRTTLTGLDQRLVEDGTIDAGMFKETQALLETYRLGKAAATATSGD
jgi:TRAP-type C4-dicarboxylate transport system substrate-binding protein